MVKIINAASCKYIYHFYTNFMNTQKQDCLLIGDKYTS